jgi:heme-degrading monooxygenase HmoA
VEAVLASRGRPRGQGSGKLMDAAQLDYFVTPFRAQRFFDLYRPAISRPLAYGADGYLFYRSEEDSDHFVHLSFWEDRAGFQRWWLSHEMQEIRVAVSGLHGQPVLPLWNTVLERG